VQQAGTSQPLPIKASCPGGYAPATPPTDRHAACSLSIARAGGREGGRAGKQAGRQGQGVLASALDRVVDNRPGGMLCLHQSCCFKPVQAACASL